MEYVDGKDLRSILNAARDRKMPIPLGLSLLVGSRLASALDYAHRKKDSDGKDLGLVHRDVSPQNVLISFEGDIKLCDFGIVKAASKASKTQMGALKGKLQYMSPEQAWGRPVDARSDIFSLGALIFEMLTGQRLFTGESEMSVLDAVREGRVQAPRDLDPRLPLEVNALVLKAL
jgi:serine/threonine protein kinase